MLGPMNLPLPVLSDSYKATHYRSYPDCTEMIAYGEFRRGYDKDTSDTRILFYGLRYVLETYLHRQWTVQDVERASAFFKTHLAPANSQFNFPKQLFLDFIEEFDGYFPIKLEALPEGSVIHARVPVYQITASGKYSPLCTYLETILTMVWYQTTVATLSRRARDIIEGAFETSVDGGRESPLVQSRLQDFGMRGCTCVEQSVLGGVAHFLSFEGSDTMSAGYYAQFHLNEGRPVSSSIPATEHSVMTAWRTERDAILNMIQTYGAALSDVLPTVALQKVEKGGFLVLRPDSGDPVETVMMALEAAEKVFGVDVNSKGYKIPRGCGVIQGDAVTMESLKAILEAVLRKGFSAQDNVYKHLTAGCEALVIVPGKQGGEEAVAFGMGSGLLQKLNRDTMSFATKLSHIRYADGSEADIMKNPTAGGKDSFPGALAVKQVCGVATVFPRDSGLVHPDEDMLLTIYDHGPVQVEWETFDALRDRVNRDWHKQPPAAEVISAELREKTKAAIQHLGSQL